MMTSLLGARRGALQEEGPGKALGSMELRLVGRS